jgi:hypothetical protein
MARLYSPTICLVGVGGTGSQFLDLYGQLGTAGHFRNSKVLIIDNDYIERSNLARQRYSHFELGSSKAEVSARCFKGLYTTPVEAIPEKLDEVLLDRVLTNPASASTMVWVLAVDNMPTRMMVYDKLVGDLNSPQLYRGNWVIIDPGNTDSTGQVCTLMKYRDNLYGIDPRILYSNYQQSYIEYRQRRRGCSLAVETQPQTLLSNTMNANLCIHSLVNIFNNHKGVGLYEWKLNDEATSLRKDFEFTLG